MSSSAGLAFFLIVSMHGYLIASPIPVANVLSSTNGTNLTLPTLEAFTNPCSALCPKQNANDNSVVKILLGQLKRKLERHAKKDKNVKHACDGDFAVLQSTIFTLSTCDANSIETAHKAIVSLQLVADLQKNISTIHSGLSNETTFYRETTAVLRQISCHMKCSGGLNSSRLQKFVTSLKNEASVALFQKGDGFVYNAELCETDFSIYHCFFFKRAHDVVNKLIDYYASFDRNV